jgi:GNAT superfamily N-acetyltransferase
MNAKLKPVVTYTCEAFDAVREEIAPLLERHYRELATFQDIPLKPNWPMYARLAKAGHLPIFTARIDGVMVGYVVYLAITSMHYSIFQAQQDVLWLAPQYRGNHIGAHLINYSEASLRDMGVVLIQQHEKLEHPELGILLAKLGYRPMDRIWVKRL